MKAENKTTTNVTLFDHIRNAVGALKDSGLSADVLGLEELGTIRELLNLDDNKEAAVIAIMAVLGDDSTVDTSDMARFLSCSHFDAKTLAAAMRTLTEKGYLTVDKDNMPLPQYEFADDVLEAIVENRKVCPVCVAQSASYDQFELCHEIHALIVKRDRKKITTDFLFSEIERLEQEHAGIEFVAKLSGQLGEVGHRAVAYELCNRFLVRGDEGWNLRTLLEGIYSSRIQAAAEQLAFRQDTHLLLELGMVRIKRDNEIVIADELLRLLYGEAAGAYTAQVKQPDRYAFASKVVEDFCEEVRKPWVDSSVVDLRAFANFENANSHLSMVKNVMTRVRQAAARLIYYLVCDNCVHGDSFKVSELSDIFSPSDYIAHNRQLKEGTHALQKAGLVELHSTGMIDKAVLELSAEGKSLFFEEDTDLFDAPVTGADIIQPDSVAEKRLFFDPELEEQLNLLCQSLHEDKYQELVKRLTDKHMPTGVCALLYGHPGTGKTECVKQLARQTGRTVMHVDISNTKSCFFGESEKLIKEVFARYRDLCKRSKVKPILLFNEADAVLSKRKDVGSGNLAQTENAIQNIILEEMENLDGILIATSNLASNLDSAFERRFLFKVRFAAPTPEAKCHIWLDKLPSLGKADAQVLAQRFPFSGGEIDNVVRKAELQEVVTGTTPTLDSIIGLCSKEKLSSERPHLGFAC